MLAALIQPLIRQNYVSTRLEVSFSTEVTVETAVIFSLSEVTFVNLQAPEKVFVPAVVAFASNAVCNPFTEPKAIVLADTLAPDITGGLTKVFIPEMLWTPDNFTTSESFAFRASPVSTYVLFVSSDELVAETVQVGKYVKELVVLDHKLLCV